MLREILTSLKVSNRCPIITDCSELFIWTLDANTSLIARGKSERGSGADVASLNTKGVLENTASEDLQGHSLFFCFFRRYEKNHIPNLGWYDMLSRNISIFYAYCVITRKLFFTATTFILLCAKNVSTTILLRCACSQNTAESISIAQQHNIPAS